MSEVSSLDAACAIKLITGDKDCNQEYSSEGIASTGLNDSSLPPPRSSCLLSAPTPSIVLTLPTPQLSQSPVFQPRSPITVAKYVHATSSRSPCPAPAVSTSSLSPAPSIPSCNRCCLAQLEDGIICRACERQWLACKMWYQANDGGRRQHLTEPFIRPAESNANVRAVMDVLGVSGSSATVGLGFGPSVTPGKKALPFEVVESPTPPPCSRCNYDSCTRPSNCPRRATPWRRLRRHSLDAVKRARDMLRTLLSLSLNSESESVVPSPRSWFWLPRGGLQLTSAFTSPAPPYDSPATSWAARIVPYRMACPATATATESSSSPSYGSSLFRRPLARVTSESRFVEHLV